MKTVQSMTGFASTEGADYRIELRAVNHRMLDVKIRLPRELASAEMPIKSALQGRFQRGAIEVKIERVGDHGVNGAEINLAAAQTYMKSLTDIRKKLGIKEAVTLSDLLSLPDVVSRSSTETNTEEAWKSIEKLVKGGIDRLQEMREHEGKTLNKVLLQAISEMQSTLVKLRARRKECESEWSSRIREKVKAVFDAHPLAGTNVQTVLESRVAQELALLIDRSDIEEELTRFGGHLEHVKKTLAGGGPVGRKLDFLLQELNREINTLGNKAQDLGMSEEVVQVKVRLEQLREQVMNLE